MKLFSAMNETQAGEFSKAQEDHIKRTREYSEKFNKAVKAKSKNFTGRFDIQEASIACTNPVKGTYLEAYLDSKSYSVLNLRISTFSSADLKELSQFSTLIKEFQEIAPMLIEWRKGYQDLVDQYIKESSNA